MQAGREIKFRGKSVETGEWVYGMMVNNLFIKDADRTPVNYIVIDNEDCAMFDEMEPLFIEVAPETVGQFIGIRDKYGRQIYEGDILVDTLGTTGEVVWMLEDCSFAALVSHPEVEYIAFESDGSLKNTWVIGNVFENPELLEVAEHASRT
ncbi:YopX family protein [Brevibacillus centrosporus]|uniref:YopX family protein n=1 Tax=Brevibacillus centrosporus TaxID=54910 RepID=UPI000F0A8845|nr:YopX family protein [Brevibacillus centrosporus]MEC2131657.1 YopX family protein [Brevibacillus centrosporus]RNB63265.1 hypothetical protein EDM55_29200 [Brevibacillus centrosporus]GED34992.1 phage protein [Brevibacillus centrosporus]